MRGSVKIEVSGLTWKTAFVQAKGLKWIYSIGLFEITSYPSLPFHTLSGWLLQALCYNPVLRSSRNFFCFKDIVHFWSSGSVRTKYFAKFAK